MVFSIYSHYQTGSTLSEVCLRAASVNEIFIGSLDQPLRLQSLIEDFERLETEESVEGRLWRWQRIQGREVRELCGDHAGEADLYVE